MPERSENPIFAIADRAAALRAAGVDVITLAAGEPESATSDAVLRAAVAAVQDPATHHYGQAAGLAELRAEVASRYPAGLVAPGDVQVAVGTKHALHLVLAALTTPGDDVVVLQPSWPGHEASAASVGAGVVRVPAGADGLVTIDTLQAALTPRTRALLLANPSNPSGAVHPPALMRQIARWCFDHDVWLVSDEVYGGLVYDGGYRPTLEAIAHQDRSRLVTVDGVSKVHAMTGWRVGWLVGPDKVVTAARGQVSRTITHVPLVTQHAALAALRDGATARTAVQQHRRNRDLLVDALRAVPGVTCPRPGGGMFAFPDVSGLLRTGPWQTAADLAAWLMEQAHVAVVPGSVFGAPDHLRISFAIGQQRLQEAADRLVGALTGIPAPA